MPNSNSLEHTNSQFSFLNQHAGPSSRLAATTTSYDTYEPINLDYFDFGRTMSPSHDQRGQDGLDPSEDNAPMDPFFVSHGQRMINTTPVFTQRTMVNPRSIFEDDTLMMGFESPTMPSTPLDEGDFGGIHTSPESQHNENLRHTGHHLRNTSSLSNAYWDSGFRPAGSSQASPLAVDQRILQPHPRRAGALSSRLGPRPRVPIGQRGSRNVLDDQDFTSDDHHPVGRISIPADEGDTTATPLTKKRGRGSRDIRIGGAKREADKEVTPESDSETSADESNEEAAVDVEKVAGYGWRAREDDDAWPAFEGTEILCPIFNENGQPIETTLHATFNVSRGQRGQVSDDGGAMVHELQKRNIFHIKDICYNLTSPRKERTRLAVKRGRFLRGIRSLSMIVKARDFDGDLRYIQEASLESRGKARKFTTAQPRSEDIAMRPRRITDSSTNVKVLGDGFAESLPDIYNAMHLEFHHATSGNRTSGEWRLPSQHYYRLVVQLCAILDGTDEVVVIAETSTELLLVRGRPPGGREKAKMKTSLTPRKPASKKVTRGPERQQRRKRTRAESLEETELPEAHDSELDGEYEVDDDLNSFQRPVGRASGDDSEDQNKNHPAQDDPTRSQHDRYIFRGLDRQEADAARSTNPNIIHRGERGTHWTQEVPGTESLVPDDEFLVHEDNAMVDPMGISGLSGVIEDGLSLFFPPHHSSYLDPLSPCISELQVAQSTSTQAGTQLDYPESDEEWRQSRGIHSQQRWRSQFPSPEIPSATMVTLTSPSNSLSSNTASLQQEDDQHGQQYGPVIASGLNETLAPPAPDWFTDFIEDQEWRYP